MKKEGSTLVMSINQHMKEFKRQFELVKMNEKRSDKEDNIFYIL